MESTESPILSPEASFVESALAYAKAGYKVFPLNPDCGPACVEPKCTKPKQPLGRLVGNGFHQATTDEQTIRQWWNSEPHANIGIPAKPNGILPIDLDTHKAEANGRTAFKNLMDGVDVTAPIQVTPGGIEGGRHVIFTHPGEGAIVGKIKLPDPASGELKESGIETRDNGYIVVAPSRLHGKAYSWVSGYGLLDINPVELPDQLREHVIGKPLANTTVVKPLLALSAEERELVYKALEFIPADDRKIWTDVGMALKIYGFEYSVWLEWSQKSNKYRPGDCQREWESFRRDGIRIATIFYHAKEYGFRFPESRYPSTDAGNAQRLADNFGHLMRWYKAEKTWLIWDGRRWKADNTERPTAYAIETTRIIFDQANDSDQRKFAASSASASRVKAMLELAKNKLAITAEMLDTDPFSLNCHNGTLDLRSGELRAHKQEDFITKLAPVEYHLHAAAPRFEQFLWEIFAGSQALIAYVRRAFGYSITGSVKEQKLFIPHGGGRNGKSVLCGAIREVLGDYAQETDPALLIGKQQSNAPSEGVYRLRGVRFATTVETPEGAKLNEVTVKQLTGGDRITARPLHGHFDEFSPTHKLWLVTNHLPEIKSQGVAIWRRIGRIPFNIQIAETQVDNDLPEKLRAEYPGILAWLIRGAQEWQQCGLNEPEEVKQATSEYKEEEDALAAFIEECCYRDPSAQVQVSLLRKAYQAWCRNNDEAELNKNAFPVRLQEKGFEKGKINSYYLWRGIGLKHLPGNGADNLSLEFQRLL